MKYYITLKQLERRKACERDVALFQRLFGSRMLVNMKNALLFNHERMAVSTGPWSWAALKFLNSVNRTKYCRSVNRYFDTYDSLTTDRDKAWYEITRKCARRFIVLYLKERGEKS